MPRVSEPRLNSATDVRKRLAHVWREVEANRMDLPKARTLAYIGQVMLGVIQASDLEARLHEVEERCKVVYEIPEKFTKDADWEAAGESAPKGKP